MRHFPAAFTVVAIALLAFSACTKHGDQSTTSSTTTTASEASSTPLADASASASPEASSEISPSPAATVAPSSSPKIAVQSVAFTDIKGDFGEQQIKDDAAAGVLDQTSGMFKPDAPITRAEFVRWLVKANNAYAKDQLSKQIRLAHTGPAMFVDMPPSNADYQYVQGLANAGYVIGINKNHFAPNRALTREELIAIKAPVDEGRDIKPTKDSFYVQQYSDVNAINPQYYAALHEDRSVRTTQNLVRIWGSIRALQPKKAVTRSEAAIAVWAVADGNAPATLGRTSPPAPK